MKDELFGKDLVLESERLILRPLEERDAKDVFEIFSDGELMRYYDLLPFKSMEKAERQTRFFMQALKDRTMIRWGIVLRENAKLVGTCGLFAFSDDDKKAELGYELNRNFQRRGIMSEALALVLDFAFSSSDINRIEAFIEPPNTASQALAGRLGFVKEGEMRDYELCRGKLIDITLWALLRRDWKSGADRNR